MNRHKLELTHAPDVDPRWTEDFIVEARLQDVPGRHIGDALAEINSHIRDSGESPYDAFGDPTRYAVELAANAPKVEDSSMVPVILPTVLQTLGMLAALNALRPALAGEPFDLTVGMVAMVALLSTAFVLMGWQSARLVRFIIDHPWIAAAASFVLFAGMVALMFIPGVVASLPAWWVVGVGVAIIIAVTVRELIKAPSAELDDPIESPSAPATQTRRGPGWATLLPTLLIPVFTVVFGVVLILL